MLFYVLFITILGINNHIEYKKKYKIEKNDIFYDPTSGHRLCSTHFTRDCFERDPLRMMELGVDGTNMPGFNGNGNQTDNIR
jgi:hypothetical protein